MNFKKWRALVCCVGVCFYLGGELALGNELDEGLMRRNVVVQKTWSLSDYVCKATPWIAFSVVTFLIGRYVFPASFETTGLPTECLPHTEALRSQYVDLQYDVESFTIDNASLPVCRDMFRIMAGWWEKCNASLASVRSQHTAAETFSSAVLTFSSTVLEQTADFIDRSYASFSESLHALRPFMSQNATNAFERQFNSTHFIYEFCRSWLSAVQLDMRSLRQFPTYSFDEIFETYCNGFLNFQWNLVLNTSSVTQATPAPNVSTSRAHFLNCSEDSSGGGWSCDLATLSAG